MATKGYVGITKKYTPVEYLESTGTQWIDTDVLPISGTRIVADFSFTVDSSITATNCMGWSSTGSAEAIALGVAADDGVNYFKANCSSNSTWITLGDVDSNRHTFDISNTALKFDDVSYGTGTLGNTATGNQTIYIFGRHIEWWDSNGGTAYTYGNVQCARQKFYSCQIYNGDTLIRNFIPALDECNKPCIVDLVNNKFYYNLGWGTFNIGSITGQETAINTSTAQLGSAMYVGIPKYSVIEYLEGTGTQYIDTGYKHNQNTRMIADIDYNSTQTGGTWIDLFGSWGDVTTAKKMMGVEDRTDTHVLSAFYGNGTSCSFGDLRGRHTYDFNKNRYRVDDTVNTFAAQTFQSQYNDLIFTSSGYTGNPGSKACMKLYYFKIYENDILVRDFVPILDDNNVACLYDRVTDTIFYNQGTGDFNAGNTTGASVSIAREIRKGYVGVNGIARQCYEPKIKYVKTITGLQNMNNKKIASVADYFILSTGYSYKTAQAIDKNLTVTTLEDISVLRYWSCGCPGKNYAFFAGGYNGGRKSNVDTYNASLVHETPTDLSGARSTCGATSIGNYTLVAGGDSYQKRVDVYDNDTLARTTGTDLTTGRKEIYATFNSTYACFGGGYNVTTVDLYDANLVHSNPTALSTSSGRRNPQNCTMGEELLVLGGSSSSVVDCYDANLVRTTLSNLTSTGTPGTIGFDTEVLVMLGTAFTNAYDIYDKNHVKRVEKLPGSCQGSGGNFQKLINHTGMGINNNAAILYRK